MKLQKINSNSPHGIPHSLPVSKEVNKTNVLQNKINQFFYTMFLKVLNYCPLSVQYALYDKKMIRLPTTPAEFYAFPTALAERLLRGMKTPTTCGTSTSDESQLLVASPFKSLVFFHDSTVPSNEYGDHFHNSDHGGFGHGKDGTNFGAIFDGCGSSIWAMKAAQAFTEASLKELAKSHREIKGSLSEIKEKAVDLFRTIARASEAGNATGGFVVFERLSATGFQVNGAAVGDVAIIHVDRTRGSAFQLNQVDKNNPHDKRDPGGSICSSQPNDPDIQKPSVFSKPVHHQDFIILASDGLIDNIQEGQAEKIIPLIIFSPVFDKDLAELVKMKKPWLDQNPDSLPSKEDLKDFIGGIDKLDRNVDNEVVAKRLNKYIKMITSEATEFIYNANQSVSAMNKDPKISQEDQEGIKTAFKEKASSFPCKTDDCMIIVLSPSGQ